jgi:hypothetical protein
MQKSEEIFTLRVLFNLKTAFQTTKYAKSTKTETLAFGTPLQTHKSTNPPRDIIPFPAPLPALPEWKTRFKEHAGEIPRGGLTRLWQADIWSQL